MSNVNQDGNPSSVTVELMEVVKAMLISGDENLIVLPEAREKVRICQEPSELVRLALNYYPRFSSDRIASVMQKRDVQEQLAAIRKELEMHLQVSMTLKG